MARLHLHGSNVTQRTPFGSVCPRGHKVEGDNARIDSKGYVRCKACVRAYTHGDLRNVAEADEMLDLMLGAKLS